MARCYVRNGVWGWTVEAQEKALADAGYLDSTALYRDTLKPALAKNPSRVRPEWLPQRVDLLRPTSRRSDLIAVATPLALGVSERDLANVLASAGKNRRATVVFVDSGMRVEPDGGMAAAAAALEAWQTARLQSRSKTTKIAGNVAAAEAKRRITAEKMKIAEPLWPLPSDEISTDEIAERSGLSVKTLYEYLRERSIAQRRRERSIKRKAAKESGDD